MARFIGDSGSNNLFGTRRSDVILGLGGEDTLFGNGGADKISGFGSIRGGGGRDKFSLVGVDREQETLLSQTNIAMGGGADHVVINTHDTTTDDGSVLHGGLYLDGGNDSFLVSGRLGATVFLGEGSDTLIAMSQNIGSYPGLDTYAGEQTVQPDAGSDTFISDGHSTFFIRGFGQNDVLEIYDTEIQSVQELRQHTAYEPNTSTTNLKITLTNGSYIVIYKAWDGFLSASNIRLHSETLQVKREVFIGNDKTPTEVIFASGADDSLISRGDTIFLGNGNDRGIGTKHDDTFRGERGDDTLLGKGGNDELRDGVGNDTIYGGTGSDVIFTSAGVDFVNAGDGRDTIFVAYEEDTIKAGGGSDTIVFRKGTIGDVSFGGDAARISTGSGLDILKFEDPFNGGVMVLEDFNLSRDHIDVSDWKTAFYPNSASWEDKLEQTFFVAYDTKKNLNIHGVEGSVLNLAGVEIYLEGISADQISLDMFLY